jgi:DNA-binding NtrC family response regulator
MSQNASEPDAAASRDTAFLVLIVDDEKDCADSQRVVLEALGYRCAVAYDVTIAMTLTESLHPDVIGCSRRSIEDSRGEAAVPYSRAA